MVPKSWSDGDNKRPDYPEDKFAYVPPIDVLSRQKTSSPELMQADHIMRGPAFRAAAAPW